MKHAKTARRFFVVTTMTQKKARYFLRWCRATRPRKFIISFLTVLFLVLPLWYVFFASNAQAAWWNETWSYRKAIAISNSSGSTLTNFQVKVLVNQDFSADVTAGKIQSDLDDLRFTAQNGELLNYWIEDSTASSADVWVKIPNIPTSGATVYVYYGNASAASGQNGDAVFEFFDDFNDGTIDANKWTVGTIGATTGTQYLESGGNLVGGNTNRYIQSANTFTGNYAAQTRVYTTTSPVNGYSTIGFYASTSNGFGLLDHNGTSYYRNDGSFSNFSYSGSGQWNRDGVSVVGTSASYSRVGETSGSASNTATNSGIIGEYLRLGSRYDNLTYDQSFSASWDWIFVRKAASADPTLSIASTEEKSPAPVGYWKFDEGTGTTANDASGKGNAVETQNTVWKQDSDCVSGKCLDFDGVAATAPVDQFEAPTNIFANGEQGALYDPDDMSMLYQDYQGTTPVTAVEQSVGLMLDKRQPSLSWNLSQRLGTETFVFSLASLGNGIVVAGTYPTGQVYRSTDSGVTWSLVQRLGTETQVLSLASLGNGIVVAGTSSTGQVYRSTDSGVTWSLVQRLGTEMTVHSLASLGNGIVVAGTSSTGQVYRSTNNSALQNHAYQSTDEKRPTLSARVNLLLATSSLSTQSVTTIATSYTLSFSGTGTITLSGTKTGTYSAGTTTLSGVTAGILTLTVSGMVNNADLRVANDGVGLPSYQRVTTATDYDTVGFPKYLKFDGVDDALVTNSIDFSGTDKMTVVAGVRKESDVARAMLVELANNQLYSFSMSAPNDTASPSYAFASAGTADVNANGTGCPSPITNVITGISDISGDIARIRVNGTQVGENTADQGTGPYGEYPLYIGGRGGTSLPFNGRLYRLVVRGAGSTDVQISKTETYVASKTGIDIAGETADPVLNAVQSISFWARPISATQSFLQLSDTVSVSSVNGVVSATGVISPTIIVNGKTNGKVEENKWNHISITTTTPIDASEIVFGTVGSTLYSGRLDEPKLYSYVRTADQIKQDYNAGIAGMSDNQGTSVAMGDKSDKWMSDGLVGYWKMDEPSWNGTSGEVKDVSGNNNNGAAVNGATTGGGKFGNGGNFDGSNDYVSTTVTDARSNIVSVSTWIKPNSTMTTRQDFIESGSSATYATNNWIFSVKGNTGSTAGLSVLGYSSSGSSNLSTVGGVLIQAVWNHVVFTSDGTTVKIYVNGVLSTSGSITVNGNNATGEFIGSGSGGTNPFNGFIDETRIYNRALSADEVKNLYQYAPGPVAHWKMDEGFSTFVSDSSGNGNTGTLTGGPTWDNGKVGKALKFDGVDDYVNMGDNANFEDLNSLTVSAWVNIDNLSDTWNYILGKSYFWGNNEFGFYTNANILGFAIDGDIGSRAQVTITDYSSYLNQWHYLTGTYDGSNVKFFLDGKLISSGSTSGKVGNNTDSFYIGRSTQGYYTKGSIDDVKIYNYARTQDQILEDMGAGDPANENPVAYYNFDEGSGATANNSGTEGSALNGTLTNMVAPATAISGWSNDGKKGKALNFDGSNDYVLSSPRIFSGDMTVSAWFKPRSFTSNWAGVGTFQYKSGTSGTGWQITPLATGVKVVVGRTGANYTTNIFPATIPTNDWSHIVATYSNGVFQVYLNGKKIGSDWSQAVVYDAAGDKIHIGRWAWDYNGYYFDGLIDEPKVYSFALTEDEIKAEFNGGSIVAQGTPKPVSVGGPATGAHARYCPPGNTEGNCASGLDPSPVGEWTLDEGVGVTAKDTSGKNNNGTLTGGPTWTQGKMGKGADFDGINDYVSVTRFTGLSTGLTLSAWVKTTSSDSSAVYAGNAAQNVFGDTTGSVGMGFGVHGGKIRYNQYTGSWQNFTGNISVNDGKWHQIAVSHSQSGAFVLYVDGKVDITGNVGINGSSAVDVIARGYSADYFTGDLDDARVYAYARTPAQIAWDYNRGKPIAWYKMDECEGGVIHDASGNGGDGTWNGTAGGSQTSVGTCQTSGTAWGNGASGKFNASLNFDGTDDYVNAGNVNLLNFVNGDYSISIWIDLASIPIGSNPRVFSYAADSNNGFSLAVGGANCNSNIVFSNKKGGSAYGSGCGGDVVSVNNWYHVLVVFNSLTNVPILYLNGKIQSGNSGGFGIPSLYNSFFIGNLGNQAYFSGQIDDVRIYNYALSVEQRKLLFNNDASLRFGQ